MRPDQRRTEDLRPIRITTGFQSAPHGSALIEWGNTWVLCAASVENEVPPFRKETGGWLTAEYAMLPGSTHPRKRRRSGGRESEIQRLIGRSLRMAVDLDALGPYTVSIDCDVLRADGGTRVASVTGGYVALALALHKMHRAGQLADVPLGQGVAAVSVGMVGAAPLLDLCYEEDVGAEVDMNVVMTGDGKLIELQGTAERRPFSRSQMDALCDLAWSGIQRLLTFQSNAIAAAKPGTPISTSLQL